MLALREESRRRAGGMQSWLGSLAAALPLLIAALHLSACGGRAELRSPEDPSEDASEDAGMGASPPRQPPRLECGRTRWTAIPWEALTLSASPRGSAPSGSRFSWWIEGGESSRFHPQGGPVAVLMPSPEESPRVHLEWLDSEGEPLGSCLFEVQVRSEGPIARCPIEPARASIDDEARLVGRALDAGAEVEARWSIVQPSAAAVNIIDDGDGVIRVNFTTTGLHTFRFEAINEHGERDQCSHSILIYRPLEIECASSEAIAKRGDRIALSGASIEQPIWGGAWTLIEGDEDGVKIVDGSRPGEAYVHLEKSGRYRFLGSFEDAIGEVDQCEIEIVVIEGSLDLSCPGKFEIAPLHAVTLRGSVTATIPWEAEWNLIERPTGSGAEAPAPLGEDRATFIADLVGHYTAEMVVRAEDGSEARCLIQLNARAQEGLRIELIWSEPVDLDLHLLSPQASYFFDDKEDCYHGTCQLVHGGNLDWGAAGDHDNPRLDIDNRERGPENINIDAPARGRYRIGVHVWIIARKLEVEAGSVRVRIYCRGELAYESDESPALFYRDLWRAADITIEGDGSCRVDPLPVVASYADPFSELIPR